MLYVILYVLISICVGIIDVIAIRRGDYIKGIPKEEMEYYGKNRIILRRHSLMFYPSLLIIIPAIVIGIIRRKLAKNP